MQKMWIVKLWRSELSRAVKVMFTIWGLGLFMAGILCIIGILSDLWR